jgi:hypothetical protein
MTFDQIATAWKKVPFRPFVLRTGSGDINVNHPEALAFTPSRRTLSIWLNEYDQAIIDLADIQEFAGPSGRREEAT